jgi:hypothetical protein
VKFIILILQNQENRNYWTSNVNTGILNRNQVDLGSLSSVGLNLFAHTVYRLHKILIIQRVECRLIGRSAINVTVTVPLLAPVYIVFGLVYPQLAHITNRSIGEFT